MNQLTTQISDSSCNTSYVWLGGEDGKNNSEEGSNPNNNVITIKQATVYANRSKGGRPNRYKE